MISGFDGCGCLNFGSAGTPPYDSECAHGLAEVEVPAVATPPALREPRRERARQRVDRPLEREHLLARRVHEVDVLGQRLAQRARHRLDAAVGDQPAADLLLDQLAELLQARLELLALRAGRRASPLVALALLARACSISRCGEVVEVELPQRAVQVVGAADGPARLHARELLHRHRREPAQLRRGPCSSARRGASRRAPRAHALAGAAAALLARHAAGLLAALAVGALAVVAVARRCRR